MRDTIVYMITFPNNKRYIGITCNSLNTRRSEHRSKVNHGSKLYVHNALRKYNNDVTWSILEHCDSYEKAQERERYYINDYKTFGDFGYNLTVGGEGSTGYKFTAEQRERMSKSHCGYNMPLQQRQAIRRGNLGKITGKARKIRVINVNTGKIKVYSSIMQAVREGFDRVGISKCCLGKRKTYKQRIWNYLE